MMSCDSAVCISWVWRKKSCSSKSANANRCWSSHFISRCLWYVYVSMSLFRIDVAFHTWFLLLLLFARSLSISHFEFSTLRLFSGIVWIICRCYKTVTADAHDAYKYTRSILLNLVLNIITRTSLSSSEKKERIERTYEKINEDGIWKKHTHTSKHQITNEY